MADTNPFYSLRNRLLVPLVVCALLAAVGVAAGSYWLAQRWATADLQMRLVGIQRTLSQSTFPLNPVVLRLLADLTQSELVTLDADAGILHQTLDGTSESLNAFDQPLPITSSHEDAGQVHVLRLGDRRFLASRFATSKRSARADNVDTVLVLFDQQLLQAARRRAAILPLATGLSTIVALSSITLIVTERLVRRIAALQRRVESVAAGDFDSQVSDNVEDEVGRLGGAVDAMARQLKQLWSTVHRQQSEKLLHQIAGGMAHQLRNSLTGARMAIELHAEECRDRDDPGIRVAIGQIEQAEDYVRRLLLVASGRQDEDRPMNVLTCLRDVQAGLAPVARHLEVDVRWDLDNALSGHQVKDGATLAAAISNLLLNAMQAADQVHVTAAVSADRMLHVAVSDNGPGICEAVADDLFEPFVSSKPEGMGLGLSVVRRAAEHLSGRVHWTRRDDRTLFDFYARVVS